MNCDDETNGAPAILGEGQRDGGTPKLGTPHPQGPFSRPVSVANITILHSPPQRPRGKKSQLSHQRVTISALGNDRVNTGLPSDLWLIPWSSRQNSQAAELDMAVSGIKLQDREE